MTRSSRPRINTAIVSRSAHQRLNIWILGPLLFVAVTVFLLFVPPVVWAQVKCKSLYKFTGGADGSRPFGGVTFDAATGNLYGTTWQGGVYGLGTVFNLAPNSDGSWSETVVQSFAGGVDGSEPHGTLIFDTKGNLYGTTLSGGAYGGGTVFKLAPNSDGTWTESLLYSFCPLLRKCVDGAEPEASVIFDQAGNLYGTTWEGGAQRQGVVFKLAPNQDGSWTESVLYSFCSLSNCVDGANPASNLTFDKSGNLYGTTNSGGTFLVDGTVFKLAPNQDGNWTESVLYSFCSLSNCVDGANPEVSVIFDQSGNLYGTSNYGGADNRGTVFELSPNANGTWKEKVIYQFTGGRQGSLPIGGVIFDQAGNLYGTTGQGGADNGNCGFFSGCGVVFMLVANSHGEWKETVLHTFVDRPGIFPSGLVFDAAGHFYGTTNGDLTKTHGSVFEITP